MTARLVRTKEAHITAAPLNRKRQKEYLISGEQKNSLILPALLTPLAFVVRVFFFFPPFVVVKVNPHASLLSTMALTKSVWSPPMYSFLVGLVGFLQAQVCPYRGGDSCLCFGLRASPATSNQPMTGRFDVAKDKER